MATAGVLAAVQRIFCAVIMDGVVARTGRSVAVGSTYLL